MSGPAPIIDKRVTRQGPRGASAWVELRDAEGRIGQGEACPLPGRSIEEIEACAELLSNISLAPSCLEVEARPAEAVGLALAPFDVALMSCPAARFAIETALLDLAAQARAISIAEILGGPRSYRAASLNGLLRLSAEFEAPLDEARRLLSSGLRALKVKLSGVDAASFSRDLETLLRLRAALPDIELRVDVNGAWPLEVARSRLAALAPLGVRFVEQPVAATELEALGACAVPWAADESLAVGPATSERLLRQGVVAAFVLKPTLLGGLVASRKLGERALASGVPVVVTHAFEGPLALAAACELALSFSRRPLACGLAPHARLADYPSVDVRQLRTPGLVCPADVPGLGVVV